MTNQFNNIYKGKKILITGHTGFKGSWLSIWLHMLGAKVIGYSLEKYYNDYVYKRAKLNELLYADEKGNINDYVRLKAIFDKHQPEMVFHLAAQPLVRLSYEIPIETLSTNIMGTANVLECIKKSSSVKCAVIITSDKCYKNKEKRERYKETDELAGHDTYSTSKACAELIVHSYRHSFFNHSDKLVASVRAGNVIGGGDWAKDRLIPDCIRHLKNKKPVRIRNPHAVRPWQHVIEPLYGYLLIGQKLIEGKKEFADAWNFGPDHGSQVSVDKVVNLIIKFWGEGKWIDISAPNEKKHETKVLKLDSTKAKKGLGWHPVLSITEAIKITVEWYKVSDHEDVYKLCTNQIKEYVKRQVST